MEDIYPIWKMCDTFRDRELSRNTDPIREKLKLEGFSGANLENRVIVGRVENKSDNGHAKSELIWAYIHRHYIKLRAGDAVDVDKVRRENPAVVDEAERALRNCIGLKFFTKRGSLIYLEPSGRMLASKPRWKNPFSCNKKQEWNFQLVFLYIKAFWPIWGLFLLLVGFILGKL